MAKLLTIANKRKLSAFFGLLATCIIALSFGLIGETTFAEIVVPLSLGFFVGNVGEHGTDAWKKHLDVAAKRLEAEIEAR